MSSAVQSTDELRHALNQRLGDDRLQGDGLASLAVDGMTPELAVTPETPEELAATLAEARELGMAVIAVGGATHLGVGNLPEAYDVAVRTTRLNGLIAHEPADLTVTAEAGIRLVDLQRHLSEHGQALPLDPPCDEGATVGGVLATNASGPMRHAFGTARDWLIGIRIAQADGSLVKSGGRVVKNVTGYDMGKLYVGSLGTLGTIVEATFKVVPLPQRQATLAIVGDTAQDLARLALRAHDAGLAMHAMELLSPPAVHAVTGHERWTLLMSVAGGHAMVERSLRDARIWTDETHCRADLLGSASAWEGWYQAFRPGGLSMRLSVRPQDVGRACEVLDRTLAGARALISCTVSAGLIRVNMTPSAGARAGALVERCSEVAARLGGSMVIDAAPVSLKRRSDVFGPVPPSFAIMRRLKEEFDPERTLSPGRFVGRL